MITVSYQHTVSANYLTRASVMPGNDSRHISGIRARLVLCSGSAASQGSGEKINTMKKLSSLQKAVLAFVLFQLMAFVPMAQIKYHAKDNIQTLISGTSTLHDWTMQTTKGECSAVFTYGAADQPAVLTSLSFAMPAEALKSEHKAMDKNAYKALKTAQYANITYVFNGTAQIQNGQLKCTGKLTIAGTTLDADLVATIKINPDRSITVSGSKKISMKDFSIDPPSFMLGTVKTGNDLTLKFDLTLVKQ